MPQTYYEILGVSEQATTEEIEAAFKSRAGEVHPDRVSPASPYLRKIAAEAFKHLSEAKAVLADADKREKYDAELASSRRSPAGASFRAASGKARPNTAFATPGLRSLFVLGVVFATILLAGGIALFRIKPADGPAPTPISTSPPAPATPAANPPQNQSSLAKKDNLRPATALTGNSEPHLPSTGASDSKSRGVVLWRASEPPDLSALNPSERQAIEETCSYARQMEGPEAYNGCLLKELTARGHK